MAAETGRPCGPMLSGSVSLAVKQCASSSGHIKVGYSGLEMVVVPGVESLPHAGLESSSDRSSLLVMMHAPHRAWHPKDMPETMSAVK